MTGTQRILAVDDEPGLTSLYEAWLEPEYSVRTATGGETALANIDDEVDAVLLDRQMPDCPGDNVLAELRNRGCTCPVALVTAAKPDTDVLELQFDAYLHKPVGRPRILDCIDELLTVGQYEGSSRKCLRLAAKVKILSQTKSLGDSGSGELIAKFKRELEAVAPRADPSVMDLLAETDSVAVPVPTTGDENPVE